MTLKEELIAQLDNETAILKHLYTKIPEGQMDFRPQEGMRSTRELLAYIANCITGTTYFYTTTETDPVKQKEQFKKFSNDAKALPFPEALNHQLKMVKGFLENVTEEDLLTKETKDFMGAPKSLLAALNESTFKYLPAYRMQLFLYAKMSGNTAINTYNNWMGIDAPVKK